MPVAQRYIQVILPLKLKWEPWYSLRDGDPDVAVGTRVKVNLSGREYVAVVRKASFNPDIAPIRIKQILSIEDTLEPISEGELRYWSFLAEYYLCTVGEVYKYVYPSGKTAVEAKRANKKGADTAEPQKPRLSPQYKDAIRNILDAFVSGKPVFLQSDRRDRQPIFDELSRRVIDAGKDVLILRPSAVRQSYVARRELAKAVRAAVPVLIEGGKQELFLPYSKLGLIIVDDEHDSSYKQEAIAPRFNVRDAAIALAAQHGSDILLTSSTPSFETIFNMDAGRYEHTEIPRSIPSVTPYIIGTGVEFNKNGMIGSLSRKLIARLEAVEGRKLLITPWELDVPLKFKKLKTVKLSKAFSENPGSYELVALINAEALISKNDFRADERALQFIKWLEIETKGELIIQTRDTRHPIFSMDNEKYLWQLMEERRSFNYPPFSRMVEIRVSDSNEARLAKMTGELTKQLGGTLRILLPKDKTLTSQKRKLMDAIGAFEAERRYYSHISIDVDP